MQPVPNYLDTSPDCNIATAAANITSRKQTSRNWAAVRGLEAKVLGEEEGSTDALPATYHYHEAPGKRVVGNPAEDTPAILRRELSLGGLADILRHLWFAGVKRSAMPNVALNFLYMYADFVSSESDFYVVNEKGFLPRKEDDAPIEWATWKTLAKEFLRMHKLNIAVVYARCLRAELRLFRINTIYRFIYFPPFSLSFRNRYNYGGLLNDNFAWMAAATVFVALVLTPMRVGFAAEGLQGHAAFQQASYGFTVFVILGPICAFGLMALGAVQSRQGPADTSWRTEQPHGGRPRHV
ncbi:hypothetical protein DL770_001837 [Monosporascus sp. CRB-9-2]|nr:hypothetical protein DL770_001837 [Monosporascus sp. CRB-9-2]